LVVVFAFTAGYPYKPAADAAYYSGKWKIVQLIRNGKIADQQQWQNDPTLWNNVYIEIKNKLAFSANPNYYDYSKNRILRYQYRVSGNHLLLTGYPNMADVADTSKKIALDSATITIHRYNQNNMQWNATIHGDILQMELSRDTSKNMINGRGDLR
jgi:hypothetical protein